MKQKLTISVDAELISTAKRYARASWCLPFIIGGAIA